MGSDPTVDMKEVLHLLRKYGNNMNQYAKKANATGKVYQEDIEKIISNQEDIWKEVNEILLRLSNI